MADRLSAFGCWCERARAAAFTPGPLTTSAAVKQAMLVDYGSRDKLFTETVSVVRDGLLRAAGTSQEMGHECVIIQGSGTMGIESVLGSVVPRNGKVLILANGAYGHRQATMCKYLGIEHELVALLDSQAVSVKDMLDPLRSAVTPFTHVSFIHHETSAGVINPLKSFASALKAEFPDIALIVDSMSGFGAYDLQMSWGIDFAVSSANKLFEGVPGFSFALCNREQLKRAEGNARSLSFDLFEQWRNIEATGQFRFTPPTHALLAFRQALLEWEAEGGVEGRSGRYKQNYEVLRRGMESMGFRFYVPEEHRSFVVMTFILPTDPRFDFQTFYDTLSGLGFVIYPGKLAQGDSFRFGTIGRLFPRDCELLLAGVRVACEKMGVALPLRQIGPTRES